VKCTHSVVWWAIVHINISKLLGTKTKQLNEIAAGFITVSSQRQSLSSAKPYVAEQYHEHYPVSDLLSGMPALCNSPTSQVQCGRTISTSTASQWHLVAACFLKADVPFFQYLNQRQVLTWCLLEISSPTRISCTGSKTLPLHQHRSATIRTAVTTQHESFSSSLYFQTLIWES